MTQYRLTPQASADLFELWRFIAGDSSEAADRVESAIYDGCAFIAEEPCAAKYARISRVFTSASGLFRDIPTT